MQEEGILRGRFVQWLNVMNNHAVFVSNNEHKHCDT